MQIAERMVKREKWSRWESNPPPLECHFAPEEGWRPIAQARPDAILCCTVAIDGSVEDRFARVPAVAAAGLMRMGVLAPGSVNLGGPGDDGLPGGLDFLYANTYGEIRYVVHAGPGTASNGALVEQAAALARAVGRPVATPADAARLLDLPPLAA
jgi:hypothetical protein